MEKIYIKKTNNLVAIKNIKENEEITFDYSTTWLEGFNCKCGKINCRGYVGDFLSLSKRLRNRYKKIGIIPEFILKKRI